MYKECKRPLIVHLNGPLFKILGKPICKYIYNVVQYTVTFDTWVHSKIIITKSTIDGYDKKCKNDYKSYKEK